ncbi:MAG: trigger factor [Clostridia bacterium]|nr:trigger factor [Clostridia bacterium]
MGLKNVTTPEKNVAVLECEIGAEEFASAVSEVFNKKKGNIQIDGFRKGKAPRAMIERRYGKGVFYEDALEKLVPPCYEEALKESGLNVVSAPEYNVTEADVETGVKFTAKVYTKPEAEIADYFGIPVKKKVDEVTDEQVDAEINRTRERNARESDVEGRPAQLGDTCNINYEGFKDEVAFAGGKGEDYDLKLGSGTFIPGFEDQLVGHNAGEEFDINVTFPEEYQAKELAGAPVVFKVKINAIKEHILPDLDDEFAKDVSDFETLDEYKADVRANLEKAAQNRAENAVTGQVVDALCEKLVCDIPEVMFRNEAENQMRDFDARLQQQGLKLSDYLKYTGLTLDQMRENMRPQAEKQVKLRLALETISKLENIEVSDEDAENEIKRLSETYSMDIERVKELVDTADIKADLAADKALKLCSEKAIPTEEEDKAEETENKEESAE